MDMVNFGTMESVLEKYKTRQLYSWVPTVTLMRTNEDENKALGETLAKKLNQASGPTAIFFPDKGLSQIDAAGNVFYNPESNQALSKSIQDNLKSEIPFVNLPFHINDQEFAKAAVEGLMEMMNS